LAHTCKVDKLRDLIGALLVMFSYLVFFSCMIDYTGTDHDIGYRNKTRPVPVATRSHRGRKQTKVRKIS